MILQGKELVSAATQRSARALTSAALAVLLAKIYAVPLENLKIFEVDIPLNAIRGSTAIIIIFLSINHFAHWWGDRRSAESWNSAEKAAGMPRISASSAILSKLDIAFERLDVLTDNDKINMAIQNASQLEHFQMEVKACREVLEGIRVSAISFGNYGAFYFFGWYMILPIGMGVAALFWPISCSWNGL